MFKGLRLRLTLLYMLTALLLVGLVGGGAYLVVARYFQGITDLALQHKMAHEFHALAAPLPPDLVPADRDWSIVRGELGLLPDLRPADRPLTMDDAAALASASYQQSEVRRVKAETERGRTVFEVEFVDGTELMVMSDGTIRDKDDDDGSRPVPLATSPTTSVDAFASVAYDAELAAIFVLPLDASGRVLFDPNPYMVPIAPQREALAQALANGSDVRTVQTADGREVRLLTYRLTRTDGPVALQLGRVLSDQARVLNQLMVSLLGLALLSVVGIGLASWWLAGRALQPAQEAWQRQQQFIASASHELRTPLTLIRASTEVALRGTPAHDQDQRELLGDVLTESDHMARLVDDLLVLSRLDSGKLPLNIAPVDLPPLLGEIQRQIARLGSERGLAVQAGSVQGRVNADPDRLHQVLLILLDNALRHTPAGGTITLAAEPQGSSICVTVRDTGNGIAPTDLPHIFERFYRADQARGRTEGNAGLGLAIAKALIEAMGGSIGATSTLGQGTDVWVRLPVSHRPPPL
ncbi:sensor histidine kinase [Candidatus Chloroploca mongolica]